MWNAVEAQTVLEGDAGFYHAYTGNNAGKLTYSFTADNSASLDKIAAGLGKDWMFLETLYRIYTTAGYNIAHVDVTAALCRRDRIRAEDVERVMDMWSSSQAELRLSADAKAAIEAHHARLSLLRRR